MKIGIFGASKAVFKKRSYNHYSERVSKHFSDHKVNWYGVQCCSINRLAYNISKHPCDLYMIQHTSTDYIYTPGSDRDFPSGFFFKSNRTEKSRKRLWDSFVKNTEFENTPITDKVFEHIDFYKNYLYDEQRRLNYIANLFLIKSLLQGKNTIHVDVEFVGEERRIFKNEYWADDITNCILEIDPLPEQTWDHDHVSKLFIREIELALTK